MRARCVPLDRRRFCSPRRAGESRAESATRLTLIAIRKCLGIGEPQIVPSAAIKRAGANEKSSPLQPIECRVTTILPLKPTIGQVVESRRYAIWSPPERPYADNPHKILEEFPFALRPATSSRNALRSRRICATPPTPMRYRTLLCHPTRLSSDLSSWTRWHSAQAPARELSGLAPHRRPRRARDRTPRCTAASRPLRLAFRE